jgi:hypothetical protein
MAHRGTVWLLKMCKHYKKINNQTVPLCLCVPFKFPPHIPHKYFSAPNCNKTTPNATYIGNKAD